MKISFCTTCKGRLHHLKRTLPVNLERNAAYPNSEFVILDYNSQDGLCDWIKDNFQDEIDSGKLTYARNPEPVHFHMAHAKNMAHRLASGDILVNLDADNYLGQDFAFYINSVFSEFDSVFLHSPKGHKRVVGGCGGRIAVRRQDFMQAGGYDERFSGWSHDDKNFIQRLKAMGLSSHLIDISYLNRIRHKKNERLENLRASDRRQGGMPNYIKAYDEVGAPAVYDTVISNNGEIGCGRVFVNFSVRPTIVAKAPTRIFGIGWHKTGTSSLHAAMGELGIRSRHWIPDLHFPLLELEKVHPSIDRSYALCDFPIPFFYARLDQLYPNSKFIFTTRTTDSFVKSVMNHLTISPRERAKRNNKKRSYRRNGAKMGAVIHHYAYARTKFDAAAFGRRFEYHNQEVKNYFADRPEDLLTIDITKPEPDEQRWARLCEFLGENKIPSTPYPRVFDTKTRLKNLERK